MSKSFNILLFFRNSSAIEVLNSAFEEIRNKNILSACFLFGKLTKSSEITDFEKLPVDVKEKERFHIFDLSDKIMISLNEIPRESITLPIFKYWYDLLLFIDTLHVIIMHDNPSTNLISVVRSVDLKAFRFFFRGLIYFNKMNIKIGSIIIYINTQKFESSVVSFKEDFLMRVIERIKNCETIQDLIDGSPTAECPVCMDVTFTESTDFRFNIRCNHLVCLSCSDQLVKYKNRFVKIYYFPFFWLARYFCLRYYIRLIYFYWIKARLGDLHIVRLDSFAW